jgi:hypothetical protein
MPTNHTKPHESRPGFLLLLFVTFVLFVGTLRSDIVIPGGLYPEQPPSDGVLIPLGTGLFDAPATGGPYGRQSNEWVDVSAGTAAGGATNMDISGCPAITQVVYSAGTFTVKGPAIGGSSGITLAQLIGGNPTNGMWITLAVDNGTLTQGGTNYTGALMVGNPYNGAWISLDIINGRVADEN